MSVWFVTGASRGFGREIVIAALEAGHQVVATVRDPGTDGLPQGYGERLLTTRLDVTHSRQVEAAVAEAVTAFGRIDVLVNNAGYGLLGAVEETSDAEVRRLFDTNVFGLLSVTRAVLPIMRGQGAGHVINLSSVAAISTVAGLSAYAATKHAVEGICEALAEEVSPYGVKVTSVQPGSFRTDFLNATSFRHAERPLPAYDGTVRALAAHLEDRRGNQPGDPAAAAKAIISIADADQAPAKLPLGSDCVAVLDGMLRARAEELAVWRELATSTDYDAA
ncbi:oxidoreductase [Streptosporangium sp. NPDC020145]|uniref:oxidoreductase n=1 Tax=Streptosporangium sp. NPDC020145 TaxID=3154694 RepID=UPI00344A5B09